MEIHQHTHTPRKKWTHYFWEFLMLFLAVFCGFLAEYKLEHTIEHQREKQFMKSMVEDLKSDTSQLNSNIIYGRKRERMVDSLVLIMSRPDYMNYGADLYYFARHLSRPHYFFPNDRTLQQLKNSGAMRLVRNSKVSDSIMNYDQLLRYIQLLFSGDEIPIRNNYREKVSQLFDGKVFYSMYDSTDLATYHKPAGNPPILSQNPEKINEFIQSAQYLKAVLRGVRVRQDSLKTSATRLISLLKREYKLE